MQKNRGFTLLELMTVVAVIGLLMAVALPSYSKYLMRAHRAEARDGLMQAHAWMERAGATGDYPTALPASMTWAADDKKRYTIAVATNTADQSYQLTATPKSNTDQRNDACGVLTLHHTGKQEAAGAAPPTNAKDCWRR